MRVRELGETDSLVVFFTPDQGLIKGVAKGARRSRKRFPNCLDLFCLTSMEYESRTRGDFKLLHSCKLVNGFPGLRTDFSSLSLASYMVELTEILFPQGVGDREAFEMMEQSFSRLDREGGGDLLRIIFEARVMALAGYGVELERCCLCGRHYAGEGRAVFKPGRGGIACMKCLKESTRSPGLEPASIKALRIMQSAPVQALMELSLDPKTTAEIRKVLELHVDYRIGRKLKTAKYL